MRLDSLSLKDFGRFRDNTIELPSEQVTVFLGANEAGKSTLMAFIRAILFGFPTQYTAQHYPSLARGAGGLITLSDSDGVSYTVERHAGVSNGLRVIAPNGPVSDPETVLRRLTGAATMDTFKNVFAFSIDELVAELNNSSIYSAGQGAPKLPDLRKSLGDRKDRIYLPRGNNQEVPRLLRHLTEVDKGLQTVRDNANDYGEATARKSEIGDELAQADAELGRIHSQQAEIENLLNGWNDWVALSDWEARLRDMPKYTQFPDNPIPRLESLEGQARQAREDRDDAAESLRLAEESAAAEIPGEDLLYDRERIEAIRRDRGSFDNSVKDLPERRAELNALESTLSDSLRDLGPDWDEARLQSFDMSLAFRQEVETGKADLAQRQQAVRDGEQRLEQEQRAQQECQTAAHEAQERLPANRPTLNAAGLARRRAALRAARGQLGEYQRARQNHDNLSGQLNSMATPPPKEEGPSVWALALAGILTAVAGVGLVVVAFFGGDLLGGTGRFVLFVVGNCLMLLSLSPLRRASHLLRRDSYAPAAPVNPLLAPLTRQTEEAQASADTAHQLLVAAAVPLALDSAPDAAALDEAEARLDVAQRELSAWDEAKEREANALRQLRAQEQRTKSAVAGLQRAKDSDAAARQDWQAWLAQHSLPDSFMPDTVIEFMGRVETIRAKLEQVLDNRRRVAAIEADIEQFRQQVEPLADRHGIPLNPDDPRQLAPSADELIRRLEETQASFSDRERAREQAEENRRLLEGRERRLQSAETELAALLAEGDADDAEDFRRRARQHEERQELEREYNDCLLRLQRISGTGERFDAFREALDKADPNRLREDAARLEELHAEVDAKRNGLREERGGIDAELARLTGEEESSALRIRHSALQEQLQEHAREWSRLAIAEALLEKTRQKFEQERQPSVIRHAQDFFAGVTGQRYQRLYAPIGESTITVTDATGASKQPAELSRGTREQLYLALRFGLIREFGEHAERLPVVVDEALVNFDPERARLAAESFAQLSETNQVLVFTCHPATADMFANAAGAQVVDISR